MSKKLLLRRPKYVPKECSYFPSSPPKSSNLEQRSSSFKDEIQPEIELLDKEHLKYENEQDIDVASHELENIGNQSDNYFKNKRVQNCRVVSVWKIDEGLLPTKDAVKRQIIDKSNVTHISAKTAPAFEKDNHTLQSTLQSEVYCHNLFQQTESFLPAPSKTVPRHILIIQIAALLKRQLSTDMNKDVGCTILTVPKKQHNFKIVPKFEIVLYDNSEFKNKDSIKPHEISEILHQQLIKTEYQGDYQQTDDEATNDISALDVSIMECHMTGKHYLRLSAHSISEIPNLKNIFPNLTAIDLSYNNFKIMPEELVELPYLEELNMRNNPVLELPENMHKMNYLRLFICSYGRLSNLPTSLFLCPNLHEIDISYNNVSCIPHISSSNKIKTLNLSGNPIRYFKKSFGYLNLEKLSLTDTWTNPVFWCAGEFSPSSADKSWDFCDLCDQTLADFSISTISFCRKFDNIIPILLSFCSSLCKNTLLPEDH